MSRNVYNSSQLTRNKENILSTKTLISSSKDFMERKKNMILRHNMDKYFFIHSSGINCSTEIALLIEAVIATLNQG